MNRKQILGAKLRKARDDKGLTRDALGARLGVTFEAVKHWEDGTNMPNKQRRLEVLKVLGIKSRKFFEGV